jgi:hypothetical protein
MHGFPHESRLFVLNVHLCLLCSVIDITQLALLQYMKCNNEGNGQKIDVYEATNNVSR